MTFWITRLSVRLIKTHVQIYTVFVSPKNIYCSFIVCFAVFQKYMVQICTIFRCTVDDKINCLRIQKKVVNLIDSFTHCIDCEKNHHKFVQTLNIEFIILFASPIYCQGDLLDIIQRMRLFNDSKTFVDMSLKQSPGSDTKRSFCLMLKKTTSL